jgi:hypothetical protein
MLLIYFSYGARFVSSPHHPDRFWGTHSLQSSGYLGLLPRGHSGPEVKLTTHLHLVPRSRMVELHLSSPTHLHGLVFNQLNTRTTLPLSFWLIHFFREKCLAIWRAYVTCLNVTHDLRFWMKYKCVIRRAESSLRSRSFISWWRIFPPFMGTENLFTCSQDPATSFHANPIYTCSVKICFNIILPFKPLTPKTCCPFGFYCYNMYI